MTFRSNDDYSVTSRSNDDYSVTSKSNDDYSVTLRSNDDYSVQALFQISSQCTESLDPRMKQRYLWENKFLISFWRRIRRPTGKIIGSLGHGNKTVASIIESTSFLLICDSTMKLHGDFCNYGLRGQ